jgi:hypothetical protein
MVALGVLLVIGIIAFWPRGGPVIQAPSVEAPAVAVVAARSANESAPAGGSEKPATNSVHTEFIKAMQAREIPLPEPISMRGPPGKPAMMEGATKDEVLGAWGAPVKVRGQTDMPATSSNGEVLPAVRTLEAWFYGSGVVVYWTSNGELSVSPFSPQDGQMLDEAMREIAEQKQRAFYAELLSTYGTNESAPAFLREFD